MLLIRDWRKKLLGLQDEQEELEVLQVEQKEKENIDEVAEPTNETSEDVHGGSEATKDIENSPNPAEMGEQDSETDESGSESKNSESNSVEMGEQQNSGSEAETDSDDANGKLNYASFYDAKLKTQRTRRLQNAFAACISKVAEDLVGYDVEGDDIWDVEALMMRRFSHRSVFSCRKSLEKSKVILALDFSKSCLAYSNFFKTISELAEKFRDVEVFNASNGFNIDEKTEEYHYNGNYSITYDKDVPFEYFKNKTIIFFGDFDGGASLVKLSKIAKVYWLSCEKRYKDLHEHSWCEGYKLQDFRGKYYVCYNERDFIKLIKKIR